MHVDCKLVESVVFQFTHPGRGATRGLRARCRRSLVSIHAPREGCDIWRALWRYNAPTFQFTHPGRGATDLQTVNAYLAKSFNSRTPGGVRRVVRSLTAIPRAFQFTHPGRGATYRRSAYSTYPGCFNSRTPGGVRQTQELLNRIHRAFQFTHLGRAATALNIHR